MRIKAYSLLEDYSPGTDDCIIVETDDGTHSLKSTKVVNPYSKVQLDNKFSEIQTSLENTEKYSVLSLDPAEVSNANDPQTIYRGRVAKEQSPYDTATILVSSKNTKGAQFGILPNGDLVIRTRRKNQNDEWGPWSSWIPIGTTDNINTGAITIDKMASESVDTDILIDGAVTLPKLATEVIETGVVDTYIVEGGEGSSFTVTGKYVLIGGMCILSVEARCTLSGAFNHFALPVPASINNYIITTASWPSGALVTPKMFYIRTNGSECYIRSSDGSALNRTHVLFTLIYSYDQNA